MTQPKTQMARQDAIYAMLKQNEAAGKVYISIQGFRKLTGIGHRYSCAADLRNFVVTTSLRQIKKNYRMDVTCKSINKAGRVVGFQFVIENHNELEKIVNAAFRIAMG